MSTELDSEIQRVLSNLRDGQLATRSFDVQSYIRAFSESAREKAIDVLDRLREDDRFRNKNPAFVSVGGGDGEELNSLLAKSNGQVGVIIEMNPQLAELARKRAVAGKTLHVIEKSAQGGIGEAMAIAVDAVRSGQSDAIVVTCHAVIHELYDRGGQKFDPLDFFGRIFAHHEIPIWFTYREPGAPETWPSVIGVSADCSPQSLLELTEAITARHPDFKSLTPKPSIVGDGIRVHKDVGMELLSKLFYLPDLSHEIDERSTALNHEQLMNALWTAVGEKARIEQRAELIPYSAPTKSFVSKWEALKIRANEIRADNSTRPLAIAQSQTRVVAHRLPPAPIQPVLEMPYEISLAQNALRSSDGPLLESLLVSCGRSWIESPDRAAGLSLLENVANSSKPKSVLSLWSRYLLSIANLFSNEFSGLKFFERSEEVEHETLRKLFKAEQMEFLRKSGGSTDKALEIANALAGGLPETQDVNSNLDRYALGTVHLLISNFLRFGGRYGDALFFIKAAEQFFNAGIASHATELAHCFYANQVCIAMTGAASFSTPKTEYVQQFAAALIELSYSHAAWFIGRIEQAEKHAERAAVGFEKLGMPAYVKRAKAVQSLLSIWRALESIILF